MRALPAMTTPEQGCLRLLGVLGAGARHLDGARHLAGRDAAGSRLLGEWYRVVAGVTR